MNFFIHRVVGPYRVTFSPEAWKLIGSMPSEAFQNLQLALERIAEVPPHRMTSDTQSSLSASVKDMTISYLLDDAQRTLTVMNIVRQEAGKLP